MTTTESEPNSREQAGCESASLVVSRTRGRPSLAEAQVLREAFLEAATQSFLDRGYAATSIEGIAREAGVAKITIYRHFVNKHELFVAVIHRTLDHARAGMHEALRCNKTSTEDCLLELIEGMYRAAVDPRTLGLQRLAIAEAARFPQLSNMIYAKTIEFLDPLVHFLKGADRAGKLKVLVPEQTAIHLFTLAVGSTQLLMTGPLNPREQRQWSKGVLDLVLLGLSPRSSGTSLHAG